MLLLPLLSLFAAVAHVCAAHDAPLHARMTRRRRVDARDLGDTVSALGSALGAAASDLGLPPPVSASNPVPSASDNASNSDPSSNPVPSASDSAPNSDPSSNPADSGANSASKSVSAPDSGPSDPAGAGSASNLPSDSPSAPPSGPSASDINNGQSISLPGPTSTDLSPSSTITSAPAASATNILDQLSSIVSGILSLTNTDSAPTDSAPTDSAPTDSAPASSGVPSFSETVVFSASKTITDGPSSVPTDGPSSVPPDGPSSVPPDGPSSAPASSTPSSDPSGPIISLPFSISVPPLSLSSTFPPPPSSVPPSGPISSAEPPPPSSVPPSGPISDPPPPSSVPPSGPSSVPPPPPSSVPPSGPISSLPPSGSGAPPSSIVPPPSSSAPGFPNGSGSSGVIPPSSSVPISPSASATPPPVSVPPDLSFILSDTSLALASVSAPPSLSLSDPDAPTSTFSLTIGAGETALPSQAPLPSGLPTRIYPPSGVISNPGSDYAFVSFLFDMFLGWQFMCTNDKASTQVLAVMPVILANALGVSTDQIKTFALQVWVPDSYHGPQDADQLQSTFLVYLPSNMTDVLQQELKTKNSAFYNGDTPLETQIASHIISTFALNSVADPNVPKNGGSSDNVNTVGATGQSKTRQDAIIGVVTTLGVIAVLVLVFLAIRAFRRRAELAHHRLSDPPDIAGVPPPNREFDQDSIGGQRRRSFYFAEDSLRGYAGERQEDMRYDSRMQGQPGMTQRRNVMPTAISAPILQQSSMNW